MALRYTLVIRSPLLVSRVLRRVLPFQLLDSLLEALGVEEVEESCVAPVAWAVGVVGPKVWIVLVSEEVAPLVRLWVERLTASLQVV